MVKILIDTNFLMIPFKFNVDIFAEFNRLFYKPKLFVLDLTIKELEKIKKTQKGKHRDYAGMALQTLGKYPINIIKTVKHLNRNLSLSKIQSVDDKIVYFAEKDDYWVATQDRGLKKKLKNKDLNIITLRQKNYLIKA